MVLTPSALYYVPQSMPTALVSQPLPSGETHVVTKLDCVNDPEGIPPTAPPTVQAVDSSYSPYVLVTCQPPNGEWIQGILVDTNTGTQWTLPAHENLGGLQGFPAYYAEVYNTEQWAEFAGPGVAGGYVDYYSGQYIPD